MTATEFRCGSCGTQLPPDSRFCNKCGAPITPAVTSAEYKQVTVLFADVVHSMDIAATVGPERLREIMTDLIDRASAVVQRYGGTVDASIFPSSMSRSIRWYAGRTPFDADVSLSSYSMTSPQPLRLARATLSSRCRATGQPISGAV
jgi:hypothetical protein